VRAASERHSLPTMSCPGRGLHAQGKRTRFRRRLLTHSPTSDVNKISFRTVLTKEPEFKMSNLQI
jgi:hypothetical protein